MWGLEEAFSEVTGRRDPAATLTCNFEGRSFTAQIVPHRKGRQFRIFLQEDLRAALGRTFLMSYMRELDRKLAKASGLIASLGSNEASERSFWEFADLELDTGSRHLRIVAHYVQKPDFPHLFAQLTGSAPMRQIDDRVLGKDDLRIHKQPWRPRSRFEMELGAINVIYMLADYVNGLIYVGEASDMIARFRRGHKPIPHWTHYRYDLLPSALAPLRVTIERMLICDIDAVSGRWAHELPASPAGYVLVNSKIDR